MNLFFQLALICIGVNNVGCKALVRSPSYPIDEAIHVQADASEPMHCSGVEQIVAFHEGLFSGSKPMSPDGMESLMKMNVRTIICVDGVAPDVKSALEYGIKTVHFPLKYTAPTESQIFDITTAALVGLERGNVYIHCHYGKHRSAATSAIVSIALGFLSVEEAKERMRVSGTSKEYKALWDAVEQQQVINASDLIRNKKHFPSTVNPQGMTAQMVAIDEAINRLQIMQISNWKIPDSHPDLAPASDAGFIAETFRSMQLAQESPYFQIDFATQVINALHHASSLEEALLQQVSQTKLDAYINHVKQSCINCHSAFRK